ncbi:hypothetical protein KEM55_003638 [Ascosphaera atra]|nr:hypothetical protein KEM55_003638 [Ascosphaera atra]
MPGFSFFPRGWRSSGDVQRRGLTKKDDAAKVVRDMDETDGANFSTSAGTFSSDDSTTTQDAKTTSDESTQSATTTVGLLSSTEIVTTTTSGGDAQTVTKTAQQTGFPSPTDGKKCPKFYQSWSCDNSGDEFYFNGCCQINPCHNNGYCPRWAWAAMSGQPNHVYPRLTLYAGYNGPTDNAVMTSTNLHNKAEKYTVTGPFAGPYSPPSPTTGAASTSSSAGGSGGISGGATAGIAVGCVAGALILAGAAFFWWWRKRKGATAATAPAQVGASLLPNTPLLSANNPQMAESHYDAAFGEAAPPYVDHAGPPLVDKTGDVGAAAAPGTAAVPAAQLPVQEQAPVELPDSSVAPEPVELDSSSQPIQPAELPSGPHPNDQPSSQSHP